MNRTCSKCTPILIIDDEFLNIFSLQMMLQPVNISTDYCFNGKECLEKIQSKISNSQCCKYYKLLIMDINMPLIDGFEATTQLR